MPHPQFAAELIERAKEKGPVTIGLAGAGQMGTDIVVQVAQMPGLRIGAISEVRPQAAIDAALLAGFDRSEIVTANSPVAIEAAIEAGKIAITEDLQALAAAGRIDAIIDATGNPNIGTLFALDVMRNGKHIVMLNVEADITIGRFLKEEARKAGVVYTGAAGDEPACTMEIIGFAQSLGFEIVAAGKGKNNPLKLDAMPADYQREAEERNMNARMLVEFVDGSKTAIEMVAIANATGLVPDVPGMHGPTATLQQLASVLCPKEDGGILNRKGVVDYSIGKGVAPGVFCIIKTRHPRILERMIDLKVGKGPYFTLYRPYHLTSLEVPLSAARAVLYKRADMQPLDHPVAEAVAVAKRPLAANETLGMIGETDYRGHAMTWEDARRSGAIPIGLAERAKVMRPLKAGELLTYDNCVPDDSMVVTQIRRRLDQSDGRFVTDAA
ncbi:homoserine dehydrogenase [Mesorhizobium sp. 8]|uniref:NAD(P)H-dependent oxidoreductase n=1 Tax=Mesorhizobium sp. 8 TaxID=2584466 RepID=UPI00111EDCA2|nr:homoserine dehydrogenase [Mesorhizobium sp. 8]QDC02738.1 homoserine dehydrogenase [Mesorhizobium sp. 8]